MFFFQTQTLHWKIKIYWRQVVLSKPWWIHEGKVLAKCSRDGGGVNNENKDHVKIKGFGKRCNNRVGLTGTCFSSASQMHRFQLASHKSSPFSQLSLIHTLHCRHFQILHHSANIYTTSLFVFHPLLAINFDKCIFTKVFAVSMSHAFQSDGTMLFFVLLRKIFFLTQLECPCFPLRLLN